MNRLTLLCSALTLAALGLFCSLAADAQPAPHVVVVCLATNGEPPDC